MKNDSINKTEDFINKAIAKHNNRYDYSLVQYEKNTIPIKIICPVHGEFKQTPKNHLKGCGCPKCGNFKRDYIPQFLKVYDDTFDYSKLMLIDDKRFTLECEKHGKFITNINEHLSGCGCPKCKEEMEKGIQISNPNTLTLSNLFIHIIQPLTIMGVGIKSNVYDKTIQNFLKDTTSGKYRLDIELYNFLLFSFITIENILLNKDINYKVSNYTAEEINQYLVTKISQSLECSTDEFNDLKNRLFKKFNSYYMLSIR